MTRILFLADCPPEPGYGSGERTLSIHRALTNLAQVDLLIVPSPNSRVSIPNDAHVVKLLHDPAQATKWFWRKRHYLLRDFRAEKRVAAMVQGLHAKHHYDAFFGRYHLPFLGQCASLGPSFIDVDDVPTDRLSAIAMVNRLQATAFRRALTGFQTVFVTKHSDLAKVQHPDVRILPCISTRPEQTGSIASAESNNRILFVGGTSFPPNREGILRFIEKSLPTIRSQIPDALLRVVGPQGRVTNRFPGVSADDFVTDIATEYSKATVLICPIWSGAGSLVKLAEAAGYGQAIVATSFAARGYEGILRPGRDLLVADSDEAFADQCITVLRDRALRMRLAVSVRRTAAANLTQSNINAIVSSAILNCLAPASEVVAVFRTGV